MRDVLLAEDVRRQDAEAQASGVAVATLMENAGRAVADTARAMLGGTYGRRIVVVCGKGNNGGDGLVAARFLGEWGAHVTAVLIEERPDRLSPLTGSALQRFGGRTVGVGAALREVARADLIVDAIFGVGLSRAPEGASSRAIEALDATAAPVLSVDVPSGVDADTGRTLGAAVRADATLTLSGLKPGLYLMPGAEHAGRVQLADIGVPPAAAGGAGIALELGDVRRSWPRRSRATHKRSVGTVLVVAGSRMMPGAAALVCGGAVHGGAGLVTLCAPEEVRDVALARTPEATFVPLASSVDGVLDAKAIEILRPRLAEFDAVALGPGLSRHPATAEAVRLLAEEVELPVVLDADGVHAFAGEPEVLTTRRAPTVLTPHAGELARLLGLSAEQIDSDRLAAARLAAARTGAIVVLKGPGTLTVSPDGRFYLNTTGSSALAQGGTGDVLTGLVAALAAQQARASGTVGPDGAALAVWLHGYAADRLAARPAPHPANASALIDELGVAIHEVAG